MSVNPGIGWLTVPPEFMVLIIVSIVVMVITVVLAVLYQTKLMRAMERGELAYVGVVGDEPVFVRRRARTAYCPRCGTPVVAGWRYCPSCGYELGRPWGRLEGREEG